MSTPSHDDRNELFAAFGRVLRDSANLYRQAAEDCIQFAPDLLPGSPDEFRRLMRELHRGLVGKIFIELVHADNKIDACERALAAELVDHLWQRRLDEGQLSATLRQLATSSARLSWSSLVRPFRKLEPLRDRVGELETVVVRLANLIAKVDGVIEPREAERLDALQRELLSALVPRRSSKRPETTHDRKSAGRAVRQMAADAAQLGAPSSKGAGADDGPTEPSAAETLDEALAELESLVGLDCIKQDVKELTNFLRVQRERTRLGLPATDVTLHMVFEGNPGTGKTTVARIVAQIFGALGVLKKGHLVETDRSGLVARYAGQTGPKTNKMVDEALDGVLFIDEAYSLVAEGENDPYGTEAVQALLKRMEDDRRRLAVVMAGYPAPMERLLQSNPGLSSRFNRRLTFPDYSAVELCRIMQLMCEKNHYELPGATRGRLLAGFQYLLNRRNEHFGNGRLVRNVFEAAIRRLANRIVDVAPLTRETLTVLVEDDVVMPDVTAAAWRELFEEAPQFEVSCPGCCISHRVPAELLGRKVECKSCTHRFRAEWGEVVA